MGSFVKRRGIAEPGSIAEALHGDASLANMRTGPDGEIALVDWEDVSAGPGVVDVASGRHGDRAARLALLRDLPTVAHKQYRHLVFRIGSRFRLD